MANEMYFVILDDQKNTGPFTRPQVEEMLAAKTLKPSTPIWKNGLEDWTTCAELEEFKKCVAPVPPPFTRVQSSAPPRVPGSQSRKVGRSPSYSDADIKSNWRKSLKLKTIIAVTAGVAIAGIVLVAVLTGRILPPMSGPKAAVYHYFGAKTVAEKHELICGADQISVDDMRRIYGEGDFNLRAVNMEVSETAGTEREKAVAVTWENRDSGKMYDGWFWVYDAEGGWCVSWISSDTPRIERPFHDLYHHGGSALAFIQVMLTDNYNYEYIHAQSTHYSLRIVDSNKTVYLAKSEPGSREIFDALKHNNSVCDIRCELSYNSPTRSEDILTAKNAELIVYSP